MVLFDTVLLQSRENISSFSLTLDFHVFFLEFSVWRDFL